MIREAIGHALLLAAEAVGALPVSRQWERDLDELRQQIGDLDAAVADRDVMRGEKAASDEIGRLKAELARWVNEAWAVAKALAPYREETSAAFVSRATDVAALVADWQDRGREIDQLKAQRAALDAAEDAAMVAQGEVHFRVPNDVESMKRYETIDATEETASKIAEWMMGGE